MATRQMKKVSTPQNETNNTKQIKEETQKTKKKFDREDYISCRSTTVGELIMVGKKSGDIYIWSSYNDSTDVQYQDLAGLVNSKSVYIFGPMFVIDDEDFIENFPALKKFYDESYTVEELEQVLYMPDKDMIATMETLPKGAINTLKTLASSAVSDGRIDSVKKIKTLDEFFGTELNLLSEIV